MIIDFMDNAESEANTFTCEVCAGSSSASDLNNFYPDTEGFNSRTILHGVADYFRSCSSVRLTINIHPIRTSPCLLDAE